MSLCGVMRGFSKIYDLPHHILVISFGQSHQNFSFAYKSSISIIKKKIHVHTGIYDLNTLMDKNKFKCYNTGVDSGFPMFSP